MKRTVLVILSNRLDRFQKPRYLELVCDEDGTVLKQKKLRAEPKTPAYHEVWENDEGRSDFDTCHRFSRKYGHKWQRKG